MFKVLIMQHDYSFYFLFSLILANVFLFVCFSFGAIYYMFSGSAWLKGFFKSSLNTSVTGSCPSPQKDDEKKEKRKRILKYCLIGVGVFLLVCGLYYYREPIYDFLTREGSLEKIKRLESEASLKIKAELKHKGYVEEDKRRLLEALIGIPQSRPQVLKASWFIEGYNYDFSQLLGKIRRIVDPYELKQLDKAITTQVNVLNNKQAFNDRLLYLLQNHGYQTINFCLSLVDSYKKSNHPEVATENFPYILNLLSTSKNSGFSFEGAPDNTNWGNKRSQSFEGDADVYIKIANELADWMFSDQQRINNFKEVAEALKELITQKRKML
jgi:hypothetical protein